MGNYHTLPLRKCENGIDTNFDVSSLCYDVLEDIVLFVGPKNWKSVELSHPDFRHVFVREDRRIWREHFEKLIEREDLSSTFFSPFCESFDDIENEAKKDNLYFKKYVCVYYLSWKGFQNEWLGNLEDDNLSYYDESDFIIEYSWKGCFGHRRRSRVKGTRGFTKNVRNERLSCLNNQIVVHMPEFHSEVDNDQNSQNFKIRLFFSDNQVRSQDAYLTEFRSGDLIYFKCRLISIQEDSRSSKHKINFECLDLSSVPYFNYSEYVDIRKNENPLLSCRNYNFSRLHYKTYFSGKNTFFSGTVFKRRSRISVMCNIDFPDDEQAKNTSELIGEVNNSDKNLRICNPYKQTVNLKLKKTFVNQRTKNLFDSVSNKDKILVIGTLDGRYGTVSVVRMDLVSTNPDSLLTFASFRILYRMVISTLINWTCLSFICLSFSHVFYNYYNCGLIRRVYYFVVSTVFNFMSPLTLFRIVGFLIGDEYQKENENCFTFFTYLILSLVCWMLHSEIWIFFFVCMLVLMGLDSLMEKMRPFVRLVQKLRILKSQKCNIQYSQVLGLLEEKGSRKLKDLSEILEGFYK